jgi:methyl-accepting chemotaxis protein
VVWIYVGLVLIVFFLFRIGRQLSSLESYLANIATTLSAQEEANRESPIGRIDHTLVSIDTKLGVIERTVYLMQSASEEPSSHLKEIGNGLAEVDKRVDKQKD